MSPELINGQQYDVKSDVWALGCLIFELCAFKPPFHQAQTQQELAGLIRDGRVPPLPSAYSPNLAQVIRHMLRQDPKQRPHTRQILNLPDVRFQLKVIDLRRTQARLNMEVASHKAREAALQERSQLLMQRQEEIVRAQEDVRRRHEAVLEREQQVALREKKVAQERQSLLVEKNRLAQALGMSFNSVGSDSSDVEDEENLPPPGSTASTPSSGGQDDDQAIKRVASRPSLVPRRPLEDRRSM